MGNSEVAFIAVLVLNGFIWAFPQLTLIIFVNFSAAEDRRDYFVIELR